MVSGWWICCLPHNEVSLLLLSLCFLVASSLATFCSIFVIVFLLVHINTYNGSHNAQLVNNGSHNAQLVNVVFVH